MSGLLRVPPFECWIRRVLYISVLIEAGYPLRRLARLHAASLARSEWCDGSRIVERESLATRDAAYEDTLPLPYRF